MPDNALSEKKAAIPRRLPDVARREPKPTRRHSEFEKTTMIPIFRRRNRRVKHRGNTITSQDGRGAFVVIEIPVVKGHDDAPFWNWPEPPRDFPRSSIDAGANLAARISCAFQSPPPCERFRDTPDHSWPPGRTNRMVAQDDSGTRSGQGHGAQEPDLVARPRIAAFSPSRTVAATIPRNLDSFAIGLVNLRGIF